MNKFFTKRFLTSVLLIVGAYTLMAWVLSNSSEHQSKTRILISKLEAYTEVLKRGLDTNTFDLAIKNLPTDLRVTIIDNVGTVTYDTEVEKIGQLSDHSRRPELQEAHYKGSGYGTRISESTGEDTFYYAEYYKGNYIRTAIPNTLEKPLPYNSARILLLFGLILLLFILWRLYKVSKDYSENIRKLGVVSRKITEGEEVSIAEFPKLETNEISKQLLELLKQKEQARKDLEESRQQLILHFQLSDTGIAIFDSSGKVEFATTHFVQFANMIASGPMTDLSELINDEALVEVKQFLDQETDSKVFTTKMHTSGQIFEVKALKSGGKSYELTITDITEEEKNRVLKQELTSNVTHEIRTPLTAIHGYLETLNYHDLTTDEREAFTEKAFQQCVRLTDMLDDITLLSKLDEQRKGFVFSQVDLQMLADEVRVAYADRLTKTGNIFHNNIPEGLIIDGNRSLLYSIFQNLVDNSLRYAGSGITMEINCYYQDSQYVYLSYHDTGIGVSPEHLPRIFERFYRVDEGRTRARGGTGLGLSIVRNAILIHNGAVQARQHVSGGLEILFTLQKHHIAPSDE